MSFPSCFCTGLLWGYCWRGRRCGSPTRDVGAITGGGRVGYAQAAATTSAPRRSDARSAVLFPPRGKVVSGTRDGGRCCLESRMLFHRRAIATMLDLFSLIACVVLVGMWLRKDYESDQFIWI